MKKYLFVFGLALLSCVNKKLNNPVSALPLDHNTINMSVGDSWLYRHTFINIPDSGTFNFPDTFVSYDYFTASKDTTIDLKPYLIIDGREYNIEMDSIAVVPNRCALHLSDTVSEYDFAGIPAEFMKRTAFHQNLNVLSMNKFGTTALKKLALSKLLAATDYDVSVYCDFAYPIMFPLVVDSNYVFRPDNDPHGNLAMHYKFLGVENINIFSGNQSAYKYAFLNDDLGLDSFPVFTWIGLNGLLKRYFYDGHMTFIDSLGAIIGTAKFWEIDELIGKSDINPDTLKPLSKSVNRVLVKF